MDREQFRNTYRLQGKQAAGNTIVHLRYTDLGHLSWVTGWRMRLVIALHLAAQGLLKWLMASFDIFYSFV
jgi:hypothetical protein